MNEQQNTESLDDILADADPAAGLNHQQAAAFHDLMRFANGKTDHAMAVLQGWAGTGKALPLDEPVLTPGGWAEMGSVGVGDFVIAGDGTPARVIGVYPQGEIDVYRVTFSDGSQVRCCKDHLWKVQTQKQSQLGSWSVLALKEMLPGIREGSRLTAGGHKKGYKYRIPLCGPVEFLPSDVCVDFYLLGYVLGNGHSPTKQRSVSVAAWEEDASEIFGMIKEYVEKTVQYGSVVRAYLNAEFCEEYRLMGLKGILSKEKFIPDELMRGSVDQRKSLLAGLMDSDGSAKGGKASFSSTSKKLAEGVCSLVRSLGGFARVSAFDRSGEGKIVEYNVSVRVPFQPFRLKRKADKYTGNLSYRHFKKQIVSAEYIGSESGQCIYVDHPDHTFITTDYTVTHNTFLVSRLINALAGSGLSIAVAAPTNKAVRVLREKIQEAGIEVPAEPVDGGRKDSWNRSWIEFGSIHSLLGLQVTERDDGTQECKSARDPSLHQYDLAIIDECSMIGSDLFSRIALAKRSCLVLFVGDPAQLPPIEAIENVSPTFSKVSFVLTLSEVVRQARDNPIIKLSMMIRQAIESGQRVDHVAIAAALPPINESPAAALVAGGFETVRDFALFEIRAGRDARVLAFTNQAVIAYNSVIHEALYGRTEFPFIAGEPVIVHSQCDGYRCNEDGSPSGIKATLITSEEARVIDVVPRDHPGFPQIPASAVTLERDSEARVVVYVPVNPFDVERLVSEKFGEWRKLKAEADEAYRCGRSARGAEIKEQAKKASSGAWAIRRAFAPLRHAYALTAHKSQGSTFDTAIVDLNDMAKMRSAFQFNRGLYVAATRPRQYLAIVA